jgi:hypothetical protein
VGIAGEHAYFPRPRVFVARDEARRLDRYNDAVTVRPVRIAALTLVIVAALLQLSFGSAATSFRIVNAAILVVAASVLTTVLLSGRRP